MNRIAVENLNNVICVFSKDVNCDKGFHNLYIFDSEKIARIVITTIENRVEINLNRLKTICSMFC